jgi:hypothetical protein
MRRRYRTPDLAPPARLSRDVWRRSVLSRRPTAHAHRVSCCIMPPSPPSASALKTFMVGPPGPPVKSPRSHVALRAAWISTGRDFVLRRWRNCLLVMRTGEHRGDLPPPVLFLPDAPNRCLCSLTRGGTLQKTWRPPITRRRLVASRRGPRSSRTRAACGRRDRVFSHQSHRRDALLSAHDAALRARVDGADVEQRL